MSNVKRLISLFLVMIMMLQIAPLEAFAQSTATMEIVVQDGDGKAVSKGVVQLKDNEGDNITFVLKNGIYEVEPAGGNDTVKLSNQGNALVKNLEPGTYNAVYLVSGKEVASKSQRIESKTDFKQVLIELPKEGGDESANQSAKPTEGLTINFEKSGVNYKLKTSNGKTVMMSNTDNSHSSFKVGGNQASFKSKKSITISGLKKDTYQLEGGGLRYKLRYDGGYKSYNIANSDVENRPVETDNENKGRIDLNIKDVRTGSPYSGGKMVITKGGKKVGLTKSGDTYTYDESTSDNVILLNGSKVSIVNLPQGEYIIKDITENDDNKLSDIILDVRNDTLSVSDEKGDIKNNLNIEIVEKGKAVNEEDEDNEEENKTKLIGGYKLSILNGSSEILKFKKEEDDGRIYYIYDEDGDVKVIESEEDEKIRLKGIPYSKVAIKEVEPAPGFDSKIDETVELKYDEDNEYRYEVVKRKYGYKIVDIEDDALEDVKVEIKNDEGKVVFTGISDEDGNIDIENIVEDEEYDMHIVSVPSPYSLPNKGEPIEIVLEGDGNFKEGNKLQIPYAKFIAKTSSGKEGSVFSFVDENGENVYRLTSDENGVIEIDRIEHGEYTISQLSVAEGYKLDENKYEITIGEDYVNIEEDEAYEFDNPKIGASTEDDKDKKSDSKLKKAIFFAIYALVFLAVIITLINLKHKEEHGENKFAIFDKIDEKFGKKDEEDDDQEIESKKSKAKEDDNKDKKSDKTNKKEENTKDK